MQTLSTELKETNLQYNPPNSQALPDLAAIKSKQKATWESGDFGQIAQSIENVAEEFMARQPLRPGLRVLDVACGTGNLALIAARHGCVVSGVDIAANLLTQARARAAAAGASVGFEEADAEALPFPNDTFDLSVSMFGVMFTPQPTVATSELRRVTRPGGQIALANWTPEGFIGKMFRVFKTHLPAPPAGIPSPMEWGNETIVQKRLQDGFTNVRLVRRIALMRYPFPPAETVDFFRKYYGPTLRAFESLAPVRQEELRRDLVELQTRHNIAGLPGQTETAAEYLEVVATKV
ncbi:MAG TPA: methyltransferase domain-containing protein [Verrucomicrobiae bacterium]|nr:methyltransferase domain-containing protein [Verrucomicrobiae bacterium]